MGQFIKYKCDVCGHEHVHDLEVFWIDKNLEINVSMLLFLTSEQCQNHWSAAIIRNITAMIVTA